MKIQFDIITQKMIETGFTIVEYYVKPEIKNDISKINCDPIIPGDLLKFYNSYTQEYKLHYYKELNDNSSPIGKECIYGNTNIINPGSLNKEVIKIQNWATTVAGGDLPLDEKDKWFKCIPFMYLANGDFMAMESNGEIRYLSHDGPSNIVSSSIFEYFEFLNFIFFAGPEWFHIDDCLVNNRYSIKSNLAILHNSYMRKILKI